MTDFWNFLSDTFLGNLRDLVAANGIRGCWLYWSRTLNEEAADFTMELDEEAGEFRILMHHCPSKGGSGRSPSSTLRGVLPTLRCAVPPGSGTAGVFL